MTEESATRVFRSIRSILIQVGNFLCGLERSSANQHMHTNTFQAFEPKLPFHLALSRKADLVQDLLYLAS